MAVRPPKSLAKVVNPDTGMSLVEAEIQAETASSLGHHGRKVEAALNRLEVAGEEERPEALTLAAREVWAFFIQRELCGMRDHRLVVREMGIPDAVLRRLGA
ncbi:DUF6665 family protein [Lutibaculum baratangense]|uniref:Uncharacterized protein n=1 Tax=Lutibaculum baratangense AMV1 TaxID=631454 RepID=V4R383_9HYPH|nr:DUF6665 family protein [Lutibaculum baratangense]ESR26377.1 hypothetical protein N177_0877 [Lutibaculum baratangense AMV1]